MAKRTLSNKLRIEILSNILTVLVKPAIEKADQNVKKQIREVFVKDPINLEANELYARFKTKYPYMFNTDSYITIKPEGKTVPILPSNIFKKEFTGNLFYMKNNLIYRINEYEIPRIFIDPLVIDIKNGGYDLLTASSGKSMAPVVNACIKKYTKEMVELADFVKGVKNILDTCRSVEQLEEGYPELKEYIPIAEQTMHAMIPVVEVKATLKILKKLQHTDVE